MPVLSKPATSSALVAHRMLEVLTGAKALPDGALSLLMGGAGDLLAHLGPFDVVAFTGSSDTGETIRALPQVIKNSVRVNVEADSLNAAILGPDVAAGDETYDYFLKDVLRDMTQKAGQKCTAIRRILVPADRADRFRDDLVERLQGITVGDPALEKVRMGGATASARGVRAGVAQLARTAVVFGSGGSRPWACRGQGSSPPSLMRSRRALPPCRAFARGLRARGHARALLGDGGGSGGLVGRGAAG